MKKMSTLSQRVPKTMRLPLKPGHKTPETRFNRFGIITTHIDGNGQTVYFDDLAYTVASVPEPSTAVLSGISLLLVALASWSRRPIRSLGPL
jgi:hypothetical protein